jgi:hypothetical protein
MEISRELKERVLDELSSVVAYEAYDEWLDDVYGLINVAGYLYSCSKVLKETDMVAYCDGYNNFISDKLEQNEWVEVDGLFYEVSEIEELKSKGAING